MAIKKLSVITLFSLIIFSLAFQNSPYARRIRPVVSTPASCQENEIAYNMTSHEFLVCTNSGYTALTTGGAGSFAPTNATYITQTANATLTNEQALSALATGILKNTTTTGVLSIAAAGTDYENPLTFNSPLSRATNTISCATCALTSGTLAQFAATTSAELAGVLSDESGATGVFVLGNFTSLTTDDTLKWDGTNWINAVASGGGGSIGTGNINMTVANDSGTGTATNLLAKLTGAPSTVRNAEITDTENALGICTSGCGTTGDATIAIAGQVDCAFDGSTTAGNYVVISATDAGKCHDAGSTFPTDKAAYGRVLTTNVGAGTYAMTLMTPDIAFQNAGNGKSRPGGSDGDIQYNSNGNQFGGSSLKREDANTIAIRNSTTTQIFNIYDTFSSGSNFARLKISVNASSQFEILSDAQTATPKNLAFGVTGAATRLVLGTGALIPSSDRGYNLGGSGNQWNQVYGFQFLVDGSGDISFGAGSRAKITSLADGAVRFRDSAGNGATFTGGSSSPSQITANQNNYNPATFAYLQRWNSDAARDITGLSLAGNQDGSTFVVINVGSNNITLKHQDTNSTEANRFLCSTGADIVLAASQSAELIYDATTQRWRAFKRN